MQLSSSEIARIVVSNGVPTGSQLTVARHEQLRSASVITRSPSISPQCCTVVSPRAVPWIGFEPLRARSWLGWPDAGTQPLPQGIPASPRSIGESANAPIFLTHSPTRLQEDRLLHDPPAIDPSYLTCSSRPPSRLPPATPSFRCVPPASRNRKRSIELIRNRFGPGPSQPPPKR
jgi:hypothetical protein